MNPQQLLRETQRAAGDKRLTEWHDTLIESGKENGTSSSSGMLSGSTRARPSSVM
jgi:hypothetical protein